MATMLQLAARYIEAGTITDAKGVLDGLLVSAPADPDVLHLAGQVDFRLGELERGRQRIEEAIRLRPASATYYNSLGILRARMMQGPEAIAAFRRALELRPDYPQALQNLAVQLAHAGELDAAEHYYLRLVAVAPQAADGWANYGILLETLGRGAQACRAFDRSLAADPGNVVAMSAKVFNSVFDPDRPPSAVLDEAREFARRHEAPLKPFWRAHANSRDPSRRLKLGYVSADFRSHSVAYFIEPVLAAHDHDEFEIYCYYSAAVNDEVTAGLAGHADHFVHVASLSPAALAERIRADGIDILIDLSGYSAGHRLLAFARRPAPVQLSWFGYLGTTGLSAIDYFLTDAVADPPEETEARFSETLLRLQPGSMCYRPPADAPPVAPLPALRNGYVTFGSFNSPLKHNERVIDLWAEVLRAVPDSRLCLKGRGLDRGSLRARTVAMFADRGVAEARLRLEPYDAGLAEHLARYGEIDIALDPFPHNGVTTTCAALWMGVPVIALNGDRHSARMAASVLINAGLPDLVARDRADYRARASTLAGDIARLEGLRSCLRAQLERTPLLDGPAVTRALERALRQSWRRWCAGGQGGGNGAGPDAIG